MDLSANIMTNWEQQYLKSTLTKSLWYPKTAWRSKQSVSQWYECCTCSAACSSACAQLTKHCVPFLQRSYLRQSVLGKLHWVESAPFIRHIMDRLATYWHLEKQYNAICSSITLQVNIHKLHCAHWLLAACIKQFKPPSKTSLGLLLIRILCITAEWNCSIIQNIVISISCHPFPG